MARKSNDSELREVWQGAAAAGDDGLRRLVERVVQQVLEAEMTAFVGVDSYERTGERGGYRNGQKPRTSKTRVGELELMVPKDRDGQLQSELFERCGRSEKTLVLGITQMYMEGVSTLDSAVEQWRERPIEKRYPYLTIDARYEKIWRGGAVVN